MADDGAGECSPDESMTGENFKLFDAIARKARTNMNRSFQFNVENIELVQQIEFQIKLIGWRFSKLEFKLDYKHNEYRPFIRFRHHVLGFVSGYLTKGAEISEKMNISDLSKVLDTDTSFISLREIAFTVATKLKKEFSQPIFADELENQ